MNKYIEQERKNTTNSFQALSKEGGEVSTKEGISYPKGKEDIKENSYLDIQKQRKMYLGVNITKTRVVEVDMHEMNTIEEPNKYLYEDNVTQDME